jgi:gas vesicle protein
MAYEYDRFEREDGGGSFLMGLLAGTVLGAGLGMLFAPKAGAELRSQLTDQAGKLRATANDTYQQATEKVSQIVDRGSDKVSQIVDRGTDKVNQMVDRGSDKVTQIVDRGTEKANQIVDRGKDAYDRARSNVSNISGSTAPATGVEPQPTFSSPGPTTRS